MTNKKTNGLSKSKSYPKVCVAIMAKNEEVNILKSLESVFGIAHEIFLYDTGSTDNTIENARKWCDENHLVFHLKQGEWEEDNFSKYRNILLDWVDEIFTGNFILLLDANDEIKNSFSLKNWLKKEFVNNTQTTSYLVHQQWYQGNYIDYWNVRIVKAKTGWRYCRRVHEVICNGGDIYKEYDHAHCVPDVIWFQDRREDQLKTNERLDRDVKALLLDLEDYPEDSRTLFYLAQTYFSKGDYESAYKYYELRVNCPNKGFEEEIFHSYFHLGILSTKLEKEFNVISGWFLMAYKCWERAEPLTYLANYCLSKNDFKLGIMFATEACLAEYPLSARLAIDQEIYAYKRYLLKAILCCRLDYLEDAFAAITTALDNVPDNEQVKGIHDAIQRKLNTQREENTKKMEELSRKLKGKIKLQTSEKEKQDWIEKWKRAYSARNVDKNLIESVLQKMAESAYNNIFG